MNAVPSRARLEQRGGIVTEGKRVKVTDAKGNLVDGTEVDVAESVERFCEVKLEDGTHLRAKLSISSAVRLDDQWDNEGNPIYLVRSQNFITVADSHDEFKRRVQ